MPKRKDDKITLRESPVTYEMYAEMPDDGNRYEVLEGELSLMSPGPATVHQVVSGELHLLLQSCRSDYVILMAPLDVILSRTNVVQPDLILIHQSRTDIVTKRGIEGSPDLLVEVLSPGSRGRDRVRKAKIYAKHGVPEYWIVDPKSQTLERYVLADGRYELEAVFEEDETVRTERLPCVSFAVSELFKNALTQRLLS